MSRVMMRGLIQVGPNHWLDAKMAHDRGLKPYVAPAGQKGGLGRPAAAPAAPAAAPARTITAADVPTAVRIEIGLDERRKALASLYDVAREQNVPFEMVDRLVRNT